MRKAQKLIQGVEEVSIHCKIIFPHAAPCSESNKL
jgi:hypothetical protein